MLLGCFSRRAEADDTRHVRRPRPQSLLLPATGKRALKRPPLGTSPDKQRTDTLGPVHLVRTKGSKITLDVVSIHRHSTQRLCRIGVEESSMRVCQGRKILYGLQCSQLVVRSLNRKKEGRIIDEILRHFPVYSARGVSWDRGNFKPVSSKQLRGPKHGPMLDG